MQYLSELPEISSISVHEDEINFEFEEKIESLLEDEYVILVGRFCDQVAIAIGKVIERKDYEPKDAEIWTRLKIKGTCVQFTI